MSNECVTAIQRHLEFFDDQWIENLPSDQRWRVSMRQNALDKARQELNGLSEDLSQCSERSRKHAMLLFRLSHCADAMTHYRGSLCGEVCLRLMIVMYVVMKTLLEDADDTIMGKIKEIAERELCPEIYRFLDGATVRKEKYGRPRGDFFIPFSIFSANS